jgi:3-deoxy-D-manno-octulosonic-acid transferase
MIWLYRLLFPFVLVAASPYYLWRMARRGGYGGGFWHRFGLPPRLPARRPGARRVWLQAVSVGEMLAVEPILRALHSDGTEVMLTTTTSTGLRVALERHADCVLGIAYFPIDWWPFSSRAWDRISPDLAIVTEGERWPEHMRQAANRGVPVLCINARISDRSFRRLAAFPFAASFVLGGMTRILAGSQQDAARFQQLGFPQDRITVTGNIKLDVDIPLLNGAARAALRRELGLPEGRLVLLGSSTWPGEEEALLAAFLAARTGGIGCLLLLVPRHAERRAEIEKLLEASGLAFHLRSRGPAAGEVAVAVGDTTGELRSLTQLADVVFVGKSLAPHTEGQTPVEAAALGKPILMGPGMGNFREIARDLLGRGAARTVTDPADLTRQVAQLLGDAALRDALSSAEEGWRRENGGGVQRTLEAIHAQLSRCP